MTFKQCCRTASWLTAGVLATATTVGILILVSFRLQTRQNNHADEVSVIAWVGVIIVALVPWWAITTATFNRQRSTAQQIKSPGTPTQGIYPPDQSFEPEVLPSSFDSLPGL